MEEVGELMGKGLCTWRDNLNLCLPFLYSFVVSLLVIVPVLAAFAVAFVPLESLNTTSLEILQNQLSTMHGTLIALVLAFVLLVVLLSLVSAFFTAGAIGMTRQALEKGKTNTKAMWSAGKIHFLNLFLASILMGFIILAGLIFIFPGAALLSPSHQPEPQTVGLLLAGLLLFILYALAMSLLLATVPYALVVDDLDAVSAIKASISFFRYNKFDVFVLWLVVIAISIGLQMIGSALTVGENQSLQPLSVITGLVNLLVLAPLSNVWWTRLYMSRTGSLKVDEVKNPW
jgi:hypothetical protein